MIRLTREVRFSIDRDWAGRVDPRRPLTNSWGGWPSAVGLVPYLRFRVSVVGEPDPATGYLCNIARLDELIRQHAIPFTAEALHREGWRLSAERLLLEVWRRLRGAVPAPATLVGLELLATPFLRYAVSKENPEMVQLTQQFEFSAAHRLHCPTMSDDENRAFYGKCNNPSGHGHNYLVEVTVAGTPSPEDGAVLPLPRFETLVDEHVIARLDHKHLNLDTAEFRDVNPTVENIARVIWDRLVGRVAPARLTNVRVYETPKTWADYAG
jgi:6-pyruvoyltetrahydropterin/6-carboxytetrahydropterin synthase